MNRWPLLRTGLLSISDRAARGQYPDAGLPALRSWLEGVILNPLELHTRLIPDELEQISAALCELSDQQHCALILTTGGTGPAPRDVTPEATLSIAHRLLPGFGEQMRHNNLRYTPTAILSRQEAVIRGQSLIINLPGQPKSICETLDGIFAAVPYCLQLIGGPYVETRAERIRAHRPASARREPEPAGTHQFEPVPSAPGDIPANHTSSIDQTPLPKL